jgi:hypothetical protein
MNSSTQVTSVPEISERVTSTKLIELISTAMAFQVIGARSSSIMAKLSPLKLSCLQNDYSSFHSEAFIVQALYTC